MRTLTKKTAGFTLVEIMIVVAIIALLAAIAVPGFLRARQRAQATTILNDARIIDGAKDQWAIEQNKSNSDVPVFSDLSPFLKANSALVRRSSSAGFLDLFANSFVVGSVGSSVQVASNTKTVKLDTAVVPSSFWGGY